MKALINLGGTITDSEITFYLPRKYRVDYLPKKYRVDWDRVDIDAVMNDGYDCTVRLNCETVARCDVSLGFSHDNEPFVWIKTTNPKATIRPVSNVRIEASINLYLYQWLVRWFYQLARFIKRKAGKI